MNRHVNHLRKAIPTDVRIAMWFAIAITIAITCMVYPPRDGVVEASHSAYGTRYYPKSK